jgi:hypothetical protein
VRQDRALCTGCAVTHIALDAGLLPRSAGPAALIGRALVAAGMTRYAADLHAALGRYRIDIEDITADGDQVTARLRVTRQTAHGDQSAGRFIITADVRDGLITHVDSNPG